MSKLFDHVAKALGEPENMQLLMTTAESMDRRQVVRWSYAATRQMLHTMAELAADPSTAGAVLRNLALVSGVDGDGPIRLVPGRFEVVGASLVRSLERDAASTGEPTTFTGNPLAAPVAWLLAAVIGRHGPRSADPEVVALFLQRECRRSIAPASQGPVAAPTPSHRSAAPVQALEPVRTPQPVGAPEPEASDEPVRSVGPVELEAADDSSPPRSVAVEEDPHRERDPVDLHVFARYVLAIGAVLWLLSVVLAPDDFNIVLVDGTTPTTESLPRSAGIRPSLPTLPTVPTLPTMPTIAPAERQGATGRQGVALGELGDPDPTAIESEDSDPSGRTGLLELDFSLVDPSGASGVTGVAEIVLDLVENQICHRFEVDGIAEPFGRVGIGRSDGQAGVVVDLGPVEPGQRACTRVSSTAMEALVASEEDHFVEVGDAGRVQVASGQNSTGGVSKGVEGPEVDEGVDPTVVSARLIARPGVLTLAGAAPSRATAERLRGELAVLDGTGIEVIDQLTIDTTAAAPTGEIKVDQTDLFAVDSHDLSSDGETVVHELAILLQHHPEWTITVSGHTDSTGDEINNLELGLRRATEVRDILIADGVPADQITAEGIGAPNPIADNGTREGRAQNRRFEIEIRRQ